MTCKDCIHEMLCFDNGTLFTYFTVAGRKTENVETNCPFKNFKNKADYIERANLLDGISSAEFGLDEIVDELIYKHNLDFLHDNDEDAVREFAKDLIDCIKNYIKTQ